jgi:hypothetical protein
MPKDGLKVISLLLHTHLLGIEETFDHTFICLGSAL